MADEVPANKKWYLSKTIWVNALGLLAVTVQQITGKDLIPPELQAQIILAVNLWLRYATNTGLEA